MAAIAIGIAGFAVVRHATAAASPDRARASAEATALVGAFSAPAASTSVTSAPVGVLSEPPARPSRPGLVTAARFWRVDSGWRSVYASLTSHPTAGFSLASNGNSPGTSAAAARSWSDDALRRLPFDISYAHLLVAVAPLTATTSAVGVYSEVTAIPTLPGARFVPLTVRNADVTGRLVRPDGRGIGPTRHRTLSVRLAQRLARAVDVLPPASTGAWSCPPAEGQFQRVTFRAATTAWGFTVDSCGGVTETRNGATEPALSSTGRLTELLSMALRRMR